MLYVTRSHALSTNTTHSKHSQVGLSNYASAYCVGLLVARRILTKLNLADTYKGQEEPDGEDYNVEPVEDGPRPFYCLLDTGLKRTSTGSKVGARACVCVCMSCLL
jgi:ribosomal protein L18